MSYTYNIGDKVVCVDDKFPALVNTLYKELPKEGQTYVVRDMQLGVTCDGRRQGEVSVLLIGVNNPHGPPPGDKERGFAGWRFVPLAEFRRVEEKIEEALKLGVGEKELVKT